MDYRKEIRKIISYINTNLIAEEPRSLYDPELCVDSFLKDDGTIRNRELIAPPTTTLLLLNSFLQNNTLLVGGSGTGKTKLASVVGSMLFQIPYEFFERQRVVGTPGATVNEIYATHDIAELNKGNDVAYLYLPFYSPFLIIDELNRFGELEQNKIREGIATDVWTYASNHSWKIPGQLVVSAINPESYGGTWPLNENLLDNYAMVLEPALYDPTGSSDLVSEADEKIRSTLGLEEAVDELMVFYKKYKNDREQVTNKITELQDKTLKEYQKRKIPLIHNGDLSKIKQEIEKVGFTQDGNLFFHSVLAEMTYSYKYGRLRFDDPASDHTHDRAYLSTKIKEGLHGRFLNNWRQASKAIAWYFGKDNADIDEIKAAFIYTANKRIKPQTEFYQPVLNDQRLIPDNFKMAKNLIELAWANYIDLKGKDKDSPTFNEIRKALRILSGERKGSASEAIKTLKASGHPFAKSLLKAIASQQYREQEK